MKRTWAALAALLAASAAGGHDRAHLPSPAAVIEIPADSAAFYGELLGLGVTGPLLLRLQNLETSPPDAAGEVRWTASGVHRLEFLDGAPALLIDAEGLAGRSGGGDSEITAGKVTLWPPSGPPLASAENIRAFHLHPPGALPEIGMEFANLRYSAVSFPPSGLALEETARVRLFRVSAAGDTESADWPEGAVRISFALEGAEAAVSSGRSGGPAARAEIRIGLLEIGADIPADRDLLAAGGHAGFRLRNAAVSLEPAALWVSLENLSAGVGSAAGAAAPPLFDLRRLDVSPALQGLLLPFPGMALPPLSVRAEGLTPENPSAGVTARMGEAALQGTVEFTEAALRDPARTVSSAAALPAFRGRLDGLLAMLRAAGAPRPQDAAALLGLFYSPEEREADSLEITVTGGSGQDFGVTVNGRPIR